MMKVRDVSLLDINTHGQGYGKTPIILNRCFALEPLKTDQWHSDQVALSNNKGWKSLRN